MASAPFPSTLTPPQHIAVVMDGNRRWASERGLPKAVGHASGARRIRDIVRACSDRGISFLTLFAFSTENWRRPPEEVSGLTRLMMRYLQRSVEDLNAHNVRLKIVGNRQGFDARLRDLMQSAEERTAANRRITLTIAANYGGRWDMLQALRGWMEAHPGAEAPADEDALRPYLSMGYAPDPDLLIRTGGESRVSNFLLWQMAYSELYFTKVLWPDFTAAQLDEALIWFQQRERRFGGAALQTLG